MKKRLKVINLRMAICISLLIISASCKKDNDDPITVTDIDNNVYKTVTIGTQVWMAENLKTTRTSDGTAISPVTENTVWLNLTTPGYCWYQNDLNNKDVYGALYNWYAVNAGNLCPVGWHVPTETDWTTLTTYLGGESVAGGKLKETGTQHWISPNNGATNESGFKALPGGYRSNTGAFGMLGGDGTWWTSPEGNPASAFYRYMSNAASSITRYSYGNRSYGFSVRCLRDN